MKRTVSFAIDGNEANVVNRVGSNVYAFQIITALERLTRADEQIEWVVLLADQAMPDLPPARPGWRYVVVGPRVMWTQFALPIHLFFHRYDALFSPGHYAPRLAMIPYISSVMDLAFLHFPDQFKTRDLIQLRDWTKYSVKRAAKVVVISKATRDDVIEQYQRSSADIIVAYPALATTNTQSQSRSTKALLQEWGINQPFFLYVGTLQPRKNLIRLLTAYEKLIDNLTNQKSVTKNRQIPQLVIAGKVGWLADEIVAHATSSRYAESIKLLGYVTDEDKTVLYQQALATVLIGLYEGFGMPPLEAMQWGSIPVVSKTSSLPEVVGKAGILVDPYDIDSIVSGLLTAFQLTAKQRAQYRKEARVQLRQFDWTTSAAEILKGMLRVVNHD